MNSLAKYGSYEQALQILADAQYRYNMLGEIVSTKDPDSLRSLCDMEARYRYEKYGEKTKEVRAPDGTTIATYSAVVTKEEPERTVERLEIADGHAARWVMEDAPQEWLDDWMQRHAKEIAMDWMMETGELIPNANVVEEHVPAKPSMYKNTVLKIKADAMRKVLGQAEDKQIGD